MPGSAERLVSIRAQSRPRDLSSVATPSPLARPQYRPRKRGALHHGTLGEGGSEARSMGPL